MVHRISLNIISYNLNCETNTMEDTLTQLNLVQGHFLVPPLNIAMFVWSKYLFISIFPAAPAGRVHDWSCVAGEEADLPGGGGGGGEDHHH